MHLVDHYPPGCIIVTSSVVSKFDPPVVLAHPAKANRIAKLNNNVFITDPFYLFFNLIKYSFVFSIIKYITIFQPPALIDVVSCVVSKFDVPVLLAHPAKANRTAKLNNNVFMLNPFA